MQLAELTCDTLIVPGTSISDPRIPNGPVIARDVEQVFDASGSHVTVWCGANPVSQFIADLYSAVVEFSGRKFLAGYQYRIVVQNSDGRLQLQPVDKTQGVPDALPVSAWTGVAGASVKYQLGTYVRNLLPRWRPLAAHRGPLPARDSAARGHLRRERDRPRGPQRGKRTARGRHDAACALSVGHGARGGPGRLCDGSRLGDGPKGHGGRGGARNGPRATPLGRDDEDGGRVRFPPPRPPMRLPAPILERESSWPNVISAIVLAIAVSAWWFALGYAYGRGAL